MKKNHIFKPYTLLLNKKKKSGFLIDFSFRGVFSFLKFRCFFNTFNFKDYFVSFNKKKEIKIDLVSDFYKKYSKFL
jgi:hypothetical protein